MRSDMVGPLRSWDTIANCKLQGGFSAEQSLEGVESVHRGLRKKKTGTLLYLFFVSRADEVWDYRNGQAINHIDTSRGGKMIRIMVNKTTLTSTHIYI